MYNGLDRAQNIFGIERENWKKKLSAPNRIPRVILGKKTSLINFTDSRGVCTYPYKFLSSLTSNFPLATNSQNHSVLTFFLCHTYLLYIRQTSYHFYYNVWLRTHISNMCMGKWTNSIQCLVKLSQHPKFEVLKFISKKNTKTSQTWQHLKFKKHSSQLNDGPSHLHICSIEEE